MLTGYTFCIPLKTKTASEVVQAYVDEICTKSGGSVKILSGNKSNLRINFSQMWLPNWVWNMKLILLPTILNPMEEIEGFHNFLNVYV